MVAEDDKADAAFCYFETILGTSFDRTCALDFQALGLPRLDLSMLGRPFTEEEVWEVVKNMAPDKAPSPDGFTGLFYTTAWPIIKGDLIRAFDALSSMDCRSFHVLNDALLTLLPKKIESRTLGDYRPISLIHSFGKIFSKVLPNRFAPHLSSLISPNQTAFIKGRHIQVPPRYH